MENGQSAVFGGRGIDEFLSSIAAAHAVPGGGSVAALAGSLAAALGEMMAGLTEGRPKFAAVESQVQNIHAKLRHVRYTLRMLVQEDAAAFQRLLDAMKLPKSTGEEKSARDKAMEQATKEATLTPLRTARAACELLEYQQVLMKIGNPCARCDLAVGSLLAYAALKGAQYNVLANIEGLKDTFFVDNAREETSDLVRKGQASVKYINDRLAAF